METPAFATRATRLLLILAFAGACVAVPANAVPANNVRLCHDNAESNPDVAIRACSEAIGSGRFAGADLASALVDRGIAYLYNENDNLAIQDFDQAIGSKPDFAAAFDWRCAANMSNHDDTRAWQDCAQAIKLDPMAARPLCRRAVMRARSGDYSGAAADIQQAISLDPNLALAYSARAYIAGRRTEYDQEIQDYGQALRLHPDAWTYGGRAWAYMEKGDYQSALQDFDQAIRLRPELPHGYSNRAWAHFKLEQYDEAIRDCEQALRIRPDANAYYWRGWCYLRKRDYEGAIRDFDQAIRLKPDAEYYSSRGHARAWRREYDKALLDYDQALRLRPNNAQDEASRRWVYYQRGLFASLWDLAVDSWRHMASLGLWNLAPLAVAGGLIYLVRRRKAKPAETVLTEPSEAARLGYDLELARKSLEAETEALPAGTNQEDAELVVAEIFVREDEAKLARALLESANIPTYLSDERTGAYDRPWVTAVAGFRLFVPAPFLNQARVLLHTEVSDAELDAQAEASPQEKDPS